MYAGLKRASFLVLGLALSIQAGAQTTDVQVRDHRTYPSDIPTRNGETTNPTPHTNPQPGLPPQQTQQTGVQLQINPFYPVDCSKGDYLAVNQVENLAKISETEDQVQFRFTSHLYRCQSRQQIPLSVNPFVVHVSVMRSGIFGSFKKKLVDVQFAAQPLMTEVILTFDKKKAFGGGKTERKFEMGFYPFGLGYPTGNGGYYYNQYFPWRLKLIKHADQSASLTFI